MIGRFPNKAEIFVFLGLTSGPSDVLPTGDDGSPLFDASGRTGGSFGVFDGVKWRQQLGRQRRGEKERRREREGGGGGFVKAVGHVDEPPRT